jgi:hypothetical protein
MRSPKPPLLATWILKHIQVGTTDDALAGDLLEEFQNGRSVAWYWRQVFAAILVGFASQVRHHWALAVRAVVIGLAVNYGALLLGHEILVKLYRNRVLDLVHFPSLAAWMVESFFSGAVTGWFVASLHRRHRNVMLFTLAAALLIWASTLPGWFLTPRDSGRFVMEALTFYLSALGGVFAGGCLVSPAPKNGTQRT